MQKHKYLVPKDMVVGQFIYTLRKNVLLAPEEAMFMFVDSGLLSTGDVMASVYERLKDEDGFMYCTITKENTFGCA